MPCDVSPVAMFYLDEILLSEQDFSSGWNLLFGARLIREPFSSTQRFHLVWDLWGVSGRQTPLPLSGPTMDHPPSTLSSFINLLASRQKVFLILGRSVFFFFPYNISHPFPKVSGLSGSLVMLVLSRSVINDDCIPDRSGAFSQIIPSIPWIIKRMKKIIINTKI